MTSSNDPYLCIYRYIERTIDSHHRIYKSVSIGGYPKNEADMKGKRKSISLETF